MILTDAGVFMYFFCNFVPLRPTRPTLCENMWVRLGHCIIS